MVKKNTFNIALLVTILAAVVFPKVAAMLYGKPWLSSVIIMLMYFGMGITTDTALLRKGISGWRTIVFVQCCLFIIAPLYAFGLYWLLIPLCGKSAAIGILFIGCIPTTITSCIMLTKRMGGDALNALYNAVLSQLLGVIVTPLLLSMFLSTQMELVSPFHTVVLGLVWKMVIPFCIGQLARPIAKYLGSVPGLVSYYGIFVLLFMNLGFVILQGDFWVLMYSLLAPIVACALLCWLLIGTILWLSKRFRFDKAQRICAVFTGSNKTLGMGIPLAMMYFPNDGDASVKVSLLIIVYYIVAMFSSVFAVEHMKAEEITQR